MKTGLFAAIAILAMSSSALAQAPAAPAGGRGAARVTRPALFFKEEWKQTEKGGEHPIVFDSTLSNPALELKVYGPSSKELLLTGDAGNELNPIHVWTGMCTTPCAVAFRHKTAYADLSGLARLRWNTKVSGFHQIRPIVKLADGTWLVGDHTDGTVRDWLFTEFSFGDVRWMKLDINRAVTTGTILDKVDLSKVDEIGFVDLMPGSGHGQGGWVDVAQVEVYGGLYPAPGRRRLNKLWKLPPELERLTRELDNFQSIAKYLMPLPGEVPRLSGIDVWGGSVQLNGSVGGDHITYIDFKQRFDLQARIERAREEGRFEVADNLQGCLRKAGIAVMDVAGHQMTDALLAAMLHQAFLLGAIYELDRYGQITRRLFENLNTRFYQSSGTHKYVSMIYGEISEDAKFRFLTAGVPFPVVFSNQHNRFMEVSEHLKISFPPLGMMPSFVIDRRLTTSLLGFKERYEMNEWSLMGRGDILLLHTDGLSDHRVQDQHYFPGRLEEVLREVKHLGSREIYEAIKKDVLAFGRPTDDISIVVIKLR